MKNLQFAAGAVSNNKPFSIELRFLSQALDEGKTAGTTEPHDLVTR